MNDNNNKAVTSSVHQYNIYTVSAYITLSWEHANCYATACPW